MQKDIRDILKFTNEWFELGLITEDKLAEFKQHYKSGEDRDSANYRWKAFAAFLSTRESFDSETLRRLYRLGETDADPSMGGSMMVTILQMKECPRDILENAAIDKQKFIRVTAKKWLAKRNRYQTA
jgi:hypothetical protein